MLLLPISVSSGKLLTFNFPITKLLNYQLSDPPPSSIAPHRNHPRLA